MMHAAVTGTPSLARTSRADERLDLSSANIFFRPLPQLNALDRTLVRAGAMAASRYVSLIEGVHHIAPERGPFILAINHMTRAEALWLPPLLFLLRNGHRIHFLADWNFRLIPGIGFLYRRAGVVSIPRKSAKPRILNALKPLFTDSCPPFEQARRHLEARRSVAIFPEGTVNRDPQRLLRGRSGTARLSLETGAPVIPVGLRFDTQASGAGCEIRIGAPLPAGQQSNPSPMQVRARHAEIMRALSDACGKAWSVNAKDRTDENL